MRLRYSGGPSSHIDRELVHVDLGGSGRPDLARIVVEELLGPVLGLFDRGLRLEVAARTLLKASRTYIGGVTEVSSKRRSGFRLELVELFLRDGLGHLGDVARLARRLTQKIFDLVCHARTIPAQAAVTMSRHVDGGVAPFVGQQHVFRGISRCPHADTAHATAACQVVYRP